MWSISIVIREKQSEPHRCSTPTDQLELFYIASASITWYNHFGEQFGIDY